VRTSASEEPPLVRLGQTPFPPECGRPLRADPDLKKATSYSVPIISNQSRLVREMGRRNSAKSGHAIKSGQSLYFFDSDSTPTPKHLTSAPILAKMLTPASVEKLQNPVLHSWIETSIKLQLLFSDKISTPDSSGSKKVLNTGSGV